MRPNRLRATALALAFLLLLGSSVAFADTVFDVAGITDLGTEPSGEVFQHIFGTVTINTTTGLVTDVNLVTTTETTAAGVWPALSFVGDSSQIFQMLDTVLNVYVLEISDSISAPTLGQLNVDFSELSLVGYHGGSEFGTLREAPSNVPAGFLLNVSYNFVPSRTGQPVPEPASLVLCAPAFATLLLIRRKRIYL